MKTKILLPVMILLLSVNMAKAQLSRELMEKTLTALSDSILRFYIIEEKAREMAAELNKIKSDENWYKQGHAKDFTNAVNQLMYSIAKDHHLNLYYSEKPLGGDFARSDSSPSWEKETREFLEGNQYGIPDTRILPGNIGYIETSLFGPLDYCAEVIAGAMQKVEDTDGLIIDLRKNPGSMDPNTIPFLSGYFFNKPVHLINFENRSAGTVRQMWSAAWVPGKKYLDKPVYILTSYQTFSGAEEFAFDFKMLKRATIIGDKTKGGANPIVGVRLNDHFHVSLPKEQALNPVTATNWEQTGVSPDIVVNAADALDLAQLKLLRNFLVKSADPVKNAVLKQAIYDIESSGNKNVPVLFKLEGNPEAGSISVAGDFNYWNPTSHYLTKKGDTWVAELSLPPGKVEYKFIVDGKWMLDPGNPNTSVINGHTNSLLTVENAIKPKQPQKLLKS